MGSVGGGVCVDFCNNRPLEGVATVEGLVSCVRDRFPDGMSPVCSVAAGKLLLGGYVSCLVSGDFSILVDLSKGRCGGDCEGAARKGGSFDSMCGAMG